MTCTRLNTMTRSQNSWQDHYTRRAQKENYAARSVYKLDEIQKKQRILRRGDRVLDLGCAPGSWLQFAAQQIGPQGVLIGVDLTPVAVSLPGNVQTVTADVFALAQTAPDIFASRFNVVLSDMAPATTGDKSGDAARSFELCRAALAVAEAVLLPGGHFVCKIFQGEDFKRFCDQVKERFNQMRIFKPQSSRKASREIFIIGVGKK